MSLAIDSMHNDLVGTKTVINAFLFHL